MYSKIGNRILDIVIALLLLIIFLPLMSVVALFIWLQDRKSVFADNSSRLGQYARKFFMFKFRSMIPNAHNIIQGDPQYSELKKQWIIQDKLAINEDPRITKVGKFIRRFDIDELAQIFNVLLGDMSIVGPRPWFQPELDRNLERYPDCEILQKYIFREKPGITGLWQIRGRNKNSIVQRFELDYEYINKKSFFFDIYIILATPFAILNKVIAGEDYEKQKR